MTLHRPTRFALAAALALAAAGALADTPDPRAPTFAPGWEAATKPLLYKGPAVGVGKTFWLVPHTLPRGDYYVITRDHGVPQLVAGQRFTIDGEIFKDINLLIDTSEHSPEAIDAHYVVMPGGASGASPSR